MTDIVFDIGFNINRQNLDRYMNRCTAFNSLLETSFGYTGVNIKIPFSLDPENTQITCLTWSDDQWIQSYITYTDYLHDIPVKEKEKQLVKKRRNTFLVFHSGRAIMSGMTPQYMKPIYNMFTDIMKGARKEIEETIGEKITEKGKCFECGEHTWEHEGRHCLTCKHHYTPKHV
jgi:hypothetical protein